MGQTVCRYVNGREVCEFEEWPTLSDWLGGQCYWTYGYNYGCRVRGRHIASPIIHLVNLVLLLLLVLMSCCVRNRDFTRSYVLFSILPMVILYVAYFVFTLNQAFFFIRGRADNFFEISIAYALFFMPTVVDFSLATGTAVFLIMSMVVACGRKEFGPVATWLPYLLTMFLSFVLGFFEMYLVYDAATTVIPTVLFLLARALFAFCIVLIILIPFVSCCCTSSNPGKSSSPVVSNAKSRLGWAAIFAIFALFPTVSRILLEHVTSIYQWNFDLIFHLAMFMKMAQPIVFTLATILFLPAYRTVFCCSNDVYYNEIAVAPAQSTNNVSRMPPPLHQAAVLPQPVQTAQQQHVDQNLIAYLTNPSQLQNFSNQLTVPPAAQCQNCKHPPIHPPSNVSNPQAMQQQQYFQPTGRPQMLLAPEMMAQQTMPMQTMVQTTISHNHQPMAQSNLVRFASQPNLVQFNTMQPAYSMPQLASVQSPFVVQQ